MASLLDKLLETTEDSRIVSPFAPEEERTDTRFPSDAELAQDPTFQRLQAAIAARRASPAPEVPMAPIAPVSTEPSLMDRISSRYKEAMPVTEKAPILRTSPAIEPKEKKAKKEPKKEETLTTAELEKAISEPKSTSLEDLFNKYNENVDSERNAAQWTTIGTMLAEGLGKIAGGVAGKKSGYYTPVDINLAPVRDQAQKNVDLALSRQKDIIEQDFKRRSTDPDSEESLASREMVKSLVPEVTNTPGFEKMTSAQLEKLIPSLFNRQGMIESARLRAQELAESRRMREDMKEDKKVETDEKQMFGRLKVMGDDLNPHNKNARGNMSKNQSKVESAERLEALAFDEQGNIQNLTDIGMTELATALASLIGQGGSQAQSQIEHLTPKTLRGDFNKQAQWLMSEPKGADQQAFTKAFMKIAGREKELAQRQIKRAQIENLGSHLETIKKYPEAAKESLKQRGLDPDYIVGREYIPETKTGLVKVKAPNGTIKLIPRDQVKGALEAGGKLAE